MDPLRAQQLAAELEVEMMADMYNRQKTATARASMDALLESLLQHTPWGTRSAWSVTTVSFGHSDQLYPIIAGHRMTGACHKKCVPPHYKEPELSKGESVCLDRCVSKYLDIHERMGKKLTELSMQDEELMKKMQQGMGPGQ